MSETTDKTFQRDFYSQFQTTSDNNDQQELALDIRKLRKNLTDAIGFLPAYDQRQCRAQMDLLERTLEDIRSTFTSKTKFTFKRKTNVALPSASPVQSHSPLGSQLLEKRDGLLAIATLNKLSSHSHRRLSLHGTTPHRNELSLTALRIHDLKETILILPNVKGSVLLQNLHRCTVIVACHQFRMHNSTGVHVYLAATSNPVIEGCSSIAFAEYPPFVSLLNPSLTEALPPNGGHVNVQDFSHIRQSPSPNWFILPPGSEDWDDILILDDAPSKQIDAILDTHLPDAACSDAA
ncbi:tubulin binding cofactor C-domain-containing protein [Multifurca ochricompacta]|uniref:Tubulin binding cofactor C-domain-containing protein n=1 Tax=Multifurca ochricompacta TaxID=376703 RepID=A0AAD4QMW8_9AGAM|nr:tubulin binding cofactor C-domain-containing protein [Multifurca ochricompacta]